MKIKWIIIGYIMVIVFNSCKFVLGDDNLIDSINSNYKYKNIPPAALEIKNHYNEKRDSFESLLVPTFSNNLDMSTVIIEKCNNSLSMLKKSQDYWVEIVCENDKNQRDLKLYSFIRYKSMVDDNVSSTLEYLNRIKKMIDKKDRSEIKKIITKLSELYTIFKKESELLYGDLPLKERVRLFRVDWYGNCYAVEEYVIVPLEGTNCVLVKIPESAK